MIPTRSSPGMSAAVRTATTPSAAAAADVSIDLTSARACAARCRRGVQHPGHPEVVDVATVAQRQLGRLVLGARRADRGAERRLERLALGDRLDGVEDLDVAGAPAQVGAEVRGHRRPVEVGALLVDLRLGAHDDARDAEPALQPAARGEGLGEPLALVGVDALQRDDLLAGDLLQAEVAADDRLAVDHHRAAAALARRRAAVLRRRDVELLAQRRQQVGVVAPHRDRRAVERELGARIALTVCQRSPRSVLPNRLDPADFEGQNRFRTAGSRPAGP